MKNILGLKIGHGKEKVVLMFKYIKSMPYPVNIKKKDLRFAKLLITQVGGPAGELGAALRYFAQKFTMPDDYGRALLNDIATEELGHVEMVSTMIYQLLKDATIEELKSTGLDKYYVEHGKGVYAINTTGEPFTCAYISVTGDPIVDLSEDMAAEQKARKTYENLIDMTDDEDIIQALLFLRQREIIHFNRFKELYNRYCENNK